MLAVITNSIAIVIGTLVGLLFKRLISPNVADRLAQALGFCALVIGIKMALRFENIIELLLCVAVGGILGAGLKLEHRLEKFAMAVQTRFVKDPNSHFAAGFSTATIMFAVGAMAVVGPINAALLNDNEVLFTKSLLDCAMSASYASLYGIGVAFSAIPLFLYQGAIALLAGLLKQLATSTVLNDISGVGGVLVMMIGINQAKIAKVPVADYLPAMGLIILSELCLSQLGLN